MNAISMQTLVGTLFFSFVHTLCSTNNSENKFFQQRYQYVLFDKYSNPITYLDIHLRVIYSLSMYQKLLHIDLFYCNTTSTFDLNV